MNDLIDEQIIVRGHHNSVETVGFSIINTKYRLDIDCRVDVGFDVKRKILSNQESIKTIREYLSTMKDEPEGYIKMSEVYHSIRRMINDE